MFFVTVSQKDMEFLWNISVLVAISIFVMEMSGLRYSAVKSR